MFLWHIPNAIQFETLLMILNLKAVTGLLRLISGYMSATWYWLPFLETTLHESVSHMSLDLSSVEKWNISLLKRFWATVIDFVIALYLSSSWSCTFFKTLIVESTTSRLELDIKLMIESWVSYSWLDLLLTVSLVSRSCFNADCMAPNVDAPWMFSMH